MSKEPFNMLVKLAVRAFYDDFNQPKTGRSDHSSRGIAVVVLDALTRRQWVKDEDLAKDLKLHVKQLRRTLRFFEEEKFIAMVDRREAAKNAKMADGELTTEGKKGEEKKKAHTYSYCSLDYEQIYDIVRYRLDQMKRKLKDELDSKNTFQGYICPKCSKRYTALDALRLISPEDEYFHCESCNGELMAENDKLAAEEMGDGDENARRRRRDKLRDMVEKMEIQLKPLMDQLAKVKDFNVPEFVTLSAWELQNNASAGSGNNGEIEVVFSGVDDKGEELKADELVRDEKVLPPWMRKVGMNLTAVQRGEVNQVNTCTDEKKSERQVGIKSKRQYMEGDDLNFEAAGDDDDDIEWEEG